MHLGSVCLRRLPYYFEFLCLLMVHLLLVLRSAQIHHFFNFEFILRFSALELPVFFVSFFVDFFQAYVLFGGKKIVRKREENIRI